MAGLINKAVALNRVRRCSFRGEEVNNFPSGIAFQYTIEKVYTNRSVAKLRLVVVTFVQSYGVSCASLPSVTVVG